MRYGVLQSDADGLEGEEDHGSMHVPSIGGDIVYGGMENTGEDKGTIQLDVCGGIGAAWDAQDADKAYSGGRKTLCFGMSDQA